MSAEYPAAAEVTDPADPRVADYVGLTDAVRRMRHDLEQGFFIAEGEKVVLRAAASGFPARSLLVSPQRYAELDPRLLDLGCPVHVASFEVLQATTGFHVHRGVLASFGRLPTRSPVDVLAGRGASSSWRRWPTTPTSALSSAASPRSAWTRCCWARAPATRCTAARCACPWGRSSRCRTPTSRRGRSRWTTCARRASACWR
jgi:hypothetical protein